MQNIAKKARLQLHKDRQNLDFSGTRSHMFAVLATMNGKSTQQGFNSEKYNSTTQSVEFVKDMQKRLISQSGPTAQNRFTWTEIKTHLNTVYALRVSVVEGGGEKGKLCLSVNKLRNYLCIQFLQYVHFTLYTVHCTLYKTRR